MLKLSSQEGDKITRDREELAVLRKLRDTNGYFSIFWVTAYQRRAYAMQRLIDSGRVINDTDILGLCYPQCHATIVGTQ